MPFTHNGQEYSDEQLAEVLSKHPELEKSYKKLESEFTKTSQSKSELEKQLEELKPWGEFDAFVRQNPTLAKQINDVYEAYTKGGNVSQTGLNSIAKAIDKAEDKGDSELAKRLEALEAQLQERQIEETLTSLEKRAKSDELDGFTLDGFNEFASKWLEEEEGVGEDDDVTPAHLKRAYTAYEAHLLKETIKRGKVPNVASNSTGAPPVKGKDANQPRGLKARSAAAMEKLLRS